MAFLSELRVEGRLFLWGVDRDRWGAELNFLRMGYNHDRPEDLTRGHSDRQMKIAPGYASLSACSHGWKTNWGPAARLRS